MLGLNSSYGNTVLMGIPIIVAALGEDALPPLLAIIALHSAILLPLAGVLVEMDVIGSQRRRPLAILATTLARTLRNPIIMSILVASLWRVSRLPVPEPLSELLRLLGSAATPLALICLGGALPSLGALAPDAGAIIGTVLKLAGLPALVWTIGRYAHLPDLPLKVAILVGGMPTGANAFLLAHRDESLSEVSAAIVMATTLCRRSRSPSGCKSSCESTRRVGRRRRRFVGPTAREAASAEISPSWPGRNRRWGRACA